MSTLVKPATSAQFIVSEANGYRSREDVTVDASGGALEAGTVLGIVTSSGKYVRHAHGASDGSEDAVGVLLNPIGAVEEAATVIVRDAEVRKSDLTYSNGANATQIAATDAALSALGITPR